MLKRFFKNNKDEKNDEKWQGGNPNGRPKLTINELKLLHLKHTNISSTNQGHGLCYYFFIVEVKKSRPASGTICESVYKTGYLHALI